MPNRAPSVPPEVADDAEFFRIRVPDPCRWLENTADPEVQAWVEEQDRRTSEFLEARTQIERCRNFLRRNHALVDPAWHCVRGERSFFLSRRPGRAHPLLCMRLADGRERVLLDPNVTGQVLDPDNIAVSPSGRYIAFALSPPGEILATLHTLDTEAEMVIEAGSVSTAVPMIIWHPRGTGFYYSRCRQLFFPDERRDGIYWHELGSAWEQDPCVKQYSDGRGHLAFAVIPDSTSMLVFTRQFSSGLSGVSLRRLDQTYVLFDELETVVEYVGAARGLLYFYTCSDAPMGRIVAIDPVRPAREAWTTVVEQSEFALARPEHFPGPAKAAISGDALLVTYVEHAHDVLYHFNVDGTLQRRIEFPVPSSVDAVVSTDGGFEIFTQSFLVPREVYRYSPDARSLVATRRTAMPDVAVDACEVRQVFYPAKDGTPIPMYLVHRRGVQPDGNHPVLLYGYGGFGQAITPEYTPDVALWLELGGIYALANIRGGGEYGEAWRAAGCALNKQTSFDDFYAAAEYLIAEGYTSPRRLCAKGISNGGLLTAVCVNQRPDLFAAIVSEVPLTDVLGLERTEAGRACTAEYGSPRASRAMFDVLRSYSPLHNIRNDGASPAQLVVVAERDFSAPPAQAYKYAAARQAALKAAGSDAPVLLRLLRGEGHTRWHYEVATRVSAEEIAFLHSFVNQN